jgi:hypothetical protein
MLLCKGGRKRGAWTTTAMAFLLFLFFLTSSSSSSSPVLLSSANLQVPSTFSCGTCFWGGFYSLGTCFLEIFRRPFPGVQVPIIGFSVPDLQNEVPCVCRSLALCLCLSPLFSLSWSLSRALSRSPSPLLRPDFLPLLSEQCKGFCITLDWVQAGERKQKGFKIQA